MAFDVGCNAIFAAKCLASFLHEIESNLEQNRFDDYVKRIVLRHFMSRHGASDLDVFGE
jgi:hypothetical protein